MSESHSQPPTHPSRVIHADDYKRMYEMSAIGIFRSTAGGRYVMANPAGVQMHGYKSETELLRAVHSIADEIYVNPRDRETMSHLLEEQGSVEGFECEIYRHKTKERFWARQNIFRVTDEDGRLWYLEGYVEDITERKRAEENNRRYRDELEQKVEERTAQLRESEQRYRTIFDTATAGIGRTLLEDGRVILANKRLAEMFGYDSADRFVSEFVFSEHYVNSDDRARLMSSYRDSPGSPIECTFTKRDGSPVIVEAHAIANYDEGILDFVATDITEHKRAEALLARAMDVTPAVFALFDPDDRLVICNRLYREMYETKAMPMVPGVEFEALVRAFAAERGIHGSAQEAEAWVAKRLGRRAAPAQSYAYQRNDGEWIEVSDHVLEDGSIFSVGLIVTERKRIEADLRQAQKMEAVGQLTGGVAHDFNNLLAVIQGNAELLADEVGHGHTLMRAIFRASTRGAELTDRLLAFSRQKPLQPRPIDLAQLVDGMMAMLKRALGETIEVETSTRGHLAQVMADPGEVENALLNLAINARDAMPEGGKLTIEYQNARLDEAYATRDPEVVAGNYVVLAVSDTGGGMSAEVKAQAFVPFFTTKEVGQGSGLGLSMVYGFAKQSGGHVSIYSEMGQGTTVKIYLPRTEEDVRGEEESRSGDIPQGLGEIVLVIEDDADVRTLAVQMLEVLGYRTVGVPDAPSANATLANGTKPDLVLSDVVLPGGISGPEFAETARETYPDLKIIFMSGYPAEAAKRNGFLDSDEVLLNKPFQRQQLAKALREALD